VVNCRPIRRELQRCRVHPSAHVVRAAPPDARRGLARRPRALDAVGAAPIEEPQRAGLLPPRFDGVWSTGATLAENSARLVGCINVFAAAAWRGETNLNPWVACCMPLAEGPDVVADLASHSLLALFLQCAVSCN
jgi:hypothetical protein